MTTSAEHPSPSRQISGDPLSPDPGPGLLRWGARPASSFLPITAVKGHIAVLPSFASARSIAAAGSLSLAALMTLTGTVVAADVPTFGYTASGNTLKASVTGDARTGVWRVRVVAPSGNRRIDFILRTGDVNWGGTVKVSRQQGNSWSLVSSRSLDEALMGGPQVSGCGAGVCWSSSAMRLPRDGDALFAVTLNPTRHGTYLLSGGVREASEAFLFGSWLKSSPTPYSH